MSENKLTIRQKLRASHVKRWHIVETTRPQTVAEHSFNVALLVEHFAEILNMDPHEIDDMRAYALHHDTPEVVLGDIPTPVKKMFIDNELYNTMAEKCDGLSASVHMHHVMLVKIADILDGVLFLNLHGVGMHAKLVRSDLVGALHMFTGLIGAELIDQYGEHSVNQLQSFISVAMDWDTERDSGEGVTWNLYKV